MSKKPEVSEANLDNPFCEVLFNYLHASVLLLDAKGRVSYMNPASERLLAVGSESAKGKAFSDLFRDGQALQQPVKEVLLSGRTVHAHEIKVITMQGTASLQVEIAPLGLPDSPSGALVWIHELSMEQAFQEENRVLDRLSMMGTLASGLAHEIRNPLGGIRAAAEMLQRDVESLEDQEYAQMIVSEVDRLNQLITQLLDFAKPKKLRKASVNINQILSELLILQKPALQRADIKLRQEFDPSLPSVYGHEASLKQAFLNLIKNAMEAMQGGGTLKVSTGYISDYRMQVGEGKPTPMAQVSISDTGVGIPEENLKSLFTPFFTTKAKGTGLGLMMTQRILKEHECLLRVSSKTGTGTTFKVLLKLAM
ncbi:MAG: PAS domain-containing protein [Deltaproteobacteria bacterium]|nr:PAS domain-containing protein [Deltaproteobacteria bacterium]